MKILFFSWRDIKHPWAGGSEINLHEIALRLVKSGHQVTVLCSRFCGEYQGASEEMVDGVRIVRVGGRYSMYLLFPFYYLWKLRSSTDVIVDIENGIPFFTPLFSSKPKCCLVHHVHKNVFFVETKFPLNIIGYLLETKMMPLLYRSVQFIAVSEDTKKDLLLLGVKPKVEVIYNGLDHQIYKTGQKKFKDPTILYLGRLRRYKRVNLLLDILKSVCQIIPNVKLIIAGDGEDRPRLEELIREYNLGSYVTVTGLVSIKDKINLMQKSWVFVTPSSMEGWGVSVIEANACGTPALAFRVPGLSESIRDGQSGYLVDNCHQMEEKVVDVLNKTNVRKRLEKGAVERALELSWDQSAARFISVLKNIQKKY